MRMPPLHYDWMMKHLPDLAGLARASLESVSTEGLIKGVASDSWPNLAATMGHSGSQSMFAMILFERCGQHVYAIGPKVSEALRSTNLTGVTADMLEAPEACFYVALPDSTWRIWGGDRTRWHTVEGFYVQKSSRFLMRQDEDTVGPKRHGLHFLLWGKSNAASHGPLDDAVYWYSVPIDADGDLEEQFGTSEVRVTDKTFGNSADSFQLEDLSTDDPKVRQEHIQTITSVFHLAVNMMLYLTSIEPDVSVLDHNVERRKVEAAIGRAKKDGKRKKLRRRLGNMPCTVITYVGPQIEASEPGNVGGSSSPEEGREAPRAHLVRPHWRHYWLGKKGSQRRVRRWIHMFERGAGDPDRTITKFREPS